MPLSVRARPSPVWRSQTRFDGARQALARYISSFFPDQISFTTSNSLLSHRSDTWRLSRKVVTRHYRGSGTSHKTETTRFELHKTWMRVDSSALARTWDLLRGWETLLLPKAGSWAVYWKCIIYLSQDTYSVSLFFPSWTFYLEA